MVGHAKVTSLQVTDPPKVRSVSGYGNKLTTSYKVRVSHAGDKELSPSQSTLWRRVYAICHSNVASHYVMILGKRYFVRDSDLHWGT